MVVSSGVEKGGTCLPPPPHRKLRSHSRAGDSFPAVQCLAVLWGQTYSDDRFKETRAVSDSYPQTTASVTVDNPESPGEERGTFRCHIHLLAGLLRYLVRCLTRAACIGPFCLGSEPLPAHLLAGSCWLILQR